MPVRYEIITPNFCEAEGLLREYGCTLGSFSCPDHVFRIRAEFRKRLPPGVLEHYNSNPGFSIREEE